MHKRTKLTTSLLVAFGGVLLSSAPIAQAQDAQKLERVTVTGSNIKRTDAETASPVQVITREEIERTGKQTVAEIIRGISADNSGTIPTAFTNGFAAGSSGVSLRGLGVNSTLVLVNGRRVAPYGLADDGQRSFVDLNTIPLEAVEKVEVLKDGASAIYGSDAIAGVVNVILRKDYKGLSMSAVGGTSQHGGGDAVRATLSGGTGDLSSDRFNVFFTGEYSKEKAIQQNTRRSYLGTSNLSTIFPGYNDFRVGGLNQYVDGIVQRVSPYGTISNPAGGPNAGRQPMTPCGPLGVSPRNVCYSDNVDFIQIQPETERLNLFGRGTFQLNADTVLFGEVGYFITRTKTRGTPSPAVSIWGNIRDNTINDTLAPLPAAHPDNPFGADAAYRYTFGFDVGGRGHDYDNRSMRLIGGVEGVLADWDYKAGVGYLETKLEDTQFGYIRNSVYQEGLTTGNFRFNNRAATLANDPTFYDRLAPRLTREPKNKVTLADLSVSKQFGQLQGGQFGIALGGEVRREESDTPATPYTFEGDIIGLGYSAFKGSRTVTALYAELTAPVLKTLELNAAFRTDRYSDYGNSTTPKFGFKFTPIKELAIRGTYAEGFRAPGPAENGDASTAGFTSILLVTTGNPDVKPEESKSYTLGLVFEPFADTNLSLDFYKIERTNEIIGADQGIILQGIPTRGTPGSTVPGSLANSLVIYGPADGDPDGLAPVAAVQAPYQNGNKTTTQGFDIDARQRFNLGEMGRMTVGLTLTHVMKYNRKFDGIDQEYEYAGYHGPYVLSSAAGTPKTRASLEVALEKANWQVAGRWNFVSGMRAIDHGGAPYSAEVDEGNGPPAGADPTTCSVFFPDGRPAPGGCRVSSFTTFDLFGKWNVSKNLTLSGSILNVFDRLAPWDPYTYGGYNYNPTYHQAGAVGRFFQVGAKYTF